MRALHANRCCCCCRRRAGGLFAALVLALPVARSDRASPRPQFAASGQWRVPRPAFRRRFRTTTSTAVFQAAELGARGGSWRATDPHRQSQQDHQRIAADLTGMFTDALDQAFAAAAEIAVLPGIRPAAVLENPLNAARALDDAPAVVQGGNDGAVVGVFVRSQSARNMCDRRFPAWRATG